VPQPGSFDSDWAAAAATPTPAPQAHGFMSGLINKYVNKAETAASNAMKMFTTGVATRHYYYNGWTRTDTMLTQTAEIDKPDQHEIIMLDLAAKTYTIIDTNVQSPPPTANPYQPPAAPGGPPPPPPKPGTMKLAVTSTSTSLGPLTIDGVPTSGYSQDFKMVASQATGSCSDGSFETTMTEYLSNFADPTIKATSAGSPGMMNMTMPMQSISGGTRQGCVPTITANHAGNASPPGGRLALYTAMTLKGASSEQSGAQSGSFVTLIERGDVRTLGSADESLFEIPPGFTKSQ